MKEIPGSRPIDRIVISERRLEGRTFGDVLEEYSADDRFDFSAIPRGDGTFYEEIEIHRISEDRQHAVAVGQDRQKSFLIRDGSVVLSGDYSGFAVRVSNDDFSRMVVEARDYRLEQFQLFTVTPESAKEFKFPDNPRRFHYETRNIDDFMVNYAAGGRTHFWIFKEFFDKHDFQHFSVKGEFERPNIFKTNSDKIIWNGQTGRRGLMHVYRNWELMAKDSGVWTVRANADLSSVAVLTSHEDGKSRVWINGKVVYDNGTRLGFPAISDDFSLLASLEDLKIKKERVKRLVAVGIEDGAVTFSNPFDKLVSMEGKDDDIVAIVERDYVKHELTVRGKALGRETSPTIVESLT